MIFVIGLVSFIGICLLLVFVQSYFGEVISAIAIAVIIYLAYTGFHFFGVQVLEWVNAK